MRTKDIMHHMVIPRTSTSTYSPLSNTLTRSSVRPLHAIQCSCMCVCVCVCVCVVNNTKVRVCVYMYVHTYCTHYTCTHSCKSLVVMDSDIGSSLH